MPSCRTAWPSRDLIRPSHQQTTHEWRQHCRGGFDLFVSQLVLDETAAGDPDAAQERLRVLADLSLLDLTQGAVTLANSLVVSLALPAKASTDAAPIALAAVHGMHFLLTWNCPHIANAEMAVAIEACCRGSGFDAPVICTPEELMGN